MAKQNEAKREERASARNELRTATARTETALKNFVAAAAGGTRGKTAK